MNALRSFALVTLLVLAATQQALAQAKKLDPVALRVSWIASGQFAMYVYGISGIPGLLFGGALADALTKRWPGGRMLLSAGMFFG